MNIITGEKIQELCDHYLMTSNQHTNPYFLNSGKFINLQLLENEFDNKSKVYCYTHALPFLIYKLHLFKNPFILVAGNSDDHFNQNLFPLLESKKILKVISQNISILHPKLYALPIGLANSMWPHGNLEIFKTAFDIQKTKEIYFYFKIETSNIKRTECYNKLTAKGLLFGKPQSYNDYVKELSSHKFSICPDGNGVDTHRLWECLYLKVVPICVRSISTEYFSKYFPIILLDDWSELDVNTLNYNDSNWDNYNMLDLNYYKNLISY